MRHFRALYISLFLLISLPGMAAGETAVSVMDKVVATLHKSKSLTADYSAEVDGHLQKGELCVCGDRFRIISPSFACWFDGSAQWTYSSSVGEVNVTEPTPEEISQINPFAIVRHFKSGYTASIVSSDAKSVVLSLKAKGSQGDIRNVLLTVSRASYLPTKAVISLSTGQKISITVTGFKSGPLLPASAFRYDPNKLPGVSVVDLR